jgi:hypothetical protein
LYATDSREVLAATGDAALGEFGRLYREVQRQNEAQWRDTLTLLEGGA